MRALLALLLALTALPALASSSFPPQAVSGVQGCSGAIASVTDTVECDVTGTASAVVSVVGTYTGTIQVQGAAPALRSRTNIVSPPAAKGS